MIGFESQIPPMLLKTRINPEPLASSFSKHPEGEHKAKYFVP
jgi:hypothetical protein